MSETTTAELPPELSVEDQAPAGEPGLVEDEMLVEEISIDGMCGVY
ncbi:MAG: mycofactocin precursor MftA [Acidimicrobiales bacterium]